MKPDRQYIERVIAEEARARRVTADEVIGSSIKRRVIKARDAAIRRLLTETGCSNGELSRAWGINPATIARAKLRSERSVYDDLTCERLRWARGPARAAQIIAGRDPRASEDIAKWRRLIARAQP